MMLYVLLAFSVVVSLFGMVNTLVLSVFERTRELGMLRAIGMTRRQARRMIRHESIITALIGAAMGLGLGVFLAALATQAMSSYGLGLTLPVKELVAFTVVAILAGHRGGRDAGPPRLAPQRAERAALRVSGAEPSPRRRVRRGDARSAERRRALADQPGELRAGLRRRARVVGRLGVVLDDELDAPGRSRRRRSGRPAAAPCRCPTRRRRR